MTRSLMTPSVLSNERLYPHHSSVVLSVKSLTTNYLLSKWSKRNPNIMKREIFNKYASDIAKRYDLTTEEMFTKKKDRHLVDARHMLYYVCSVRPIGLSYIQKYMGENGYDICHSSIIHGIKKITKELETDADYQSVVSDITNHLSS